MVDPGLAVPARLRWRNSALRLQMPKDFSDAITTRQMAATRSHAKTHKRSAAKIGFIKTEAEIPRLAFEIFSGRKRLKAGMLMLTYIAVEALKLGLDCSILLVGSDRAACLGTEM